ncbi:sugar ABC transporter substrate-binding protein [bacterium 1XD21-13]|nr:sugar ABC transporter substrate-binding protein [bacterium 1XD21-13]
MKRKLLSVILAAAMVTAMLAGCGSKQEEAPAATGGEAGTEAPAAEGEAEAPAESAGGAGGLVGVAMPTKDLQRWNQDGSNMKAELEAAGYTVDLQYASNDNATMVSQIETMIANECKVLVIASIDGDALGTVLAQAKEKNIPVIAYDRLLKNSDAVTYYATFDNYMVGQKQGEYIKEALDLDNAEGPFNLEIFTGDPGDNNATFFYGGAMDVLNPYIDSGKLVIQSGQKEFAEVATANWATETAQSRMDAILASYYADGTTLDVVLCSNDSTALGVTNALDAAYTGEWPIITGQDCDIANVKNMIAGKQSMSIFKDTRTLASQVVKMVDSIMKGEEAEVNDTETYDNGVIVVPSYLCEPVFADANNYKELLIDSGYYTEDDLK